jgi:hypothetical protein
VTLHAGMWYEYFRHQLALTSDAVCSSCLHLYHPRIPRQSVSGDRRAAGREAAIFILQVG